MTVVSYEQFPGFEHIYFEDSYILDILEGREGLFVVVDAAILETDKWYRAKKPNEQHCYQRIIIAFEAVNSLRWIRKEPKVTAPKLFDTDIGCILEFQKENGTYMMWGPWGHFECVARQLRILRDSEELG